MQKEDGVVRREVVIKVLQANGVSVSPQQGMSIGNLVLARGAVLDARKFPDEVGRQTVRYLSEKFEIPTHKFYE